MRNLEVYTDGATSKNGYDGAKGGFAFIVLEGDKVIGAGKGTNQRDEIPTNQRMELWAAISGCNNALSQLEDEEGDIRIYSDSAYLVNCYSQGWWRKWVKNGWVNSKKEPVKNQDLWEKLIPLFEKKNVHFIKVKGHTGKKDYNAMVDEMAVQACGGSK